MVLTPKKFASKFRWVQDIFTEQLKVMFDFSNKVVTLFKQSKCFTENILWLYDSTTHFSLFFRSSAVNYISYKCERQNNCPKIISGKDNTVKPDNNFFTLFFSSWFRASISYVLNMVLLPTAFLPPEGALQSFWLVQTHEAQPMKLWMLKWLL